MPELLAPILEFANRRWNVSPRNGGVKWFFQSLLVGKKTPGKTTGLRKLQPIVASQTPMSCSRDE